MDVQSAHVVNTGVQKVVGWTKELEVSGSMQEGRADRQLPVDASQRIKAFKKKKSLVSVQGAL